MNMKMPENPGVDIYRMMYLIRKSEEAIVQNYRDDEMKTPMHMSMGAEAIDAGVCYALRSSDQVMGSYRSHGLYLAKTGETDHFFAELYGKVTGTAKGKAGSMHLTSLSHGLLGTSAIVASHIPVAVGAAFANRIKRNDKIVAAFFGDGAIDEGGFWESLNVACLKELPIAFVCQDNGFAVHVPSGERHGYNSIARIVEQFNIDVVESDTTDAEEIYRLSKNAFSIVRQRCRPCFLHFDYYRYLEHVGVYEDFKSGYRNREDFEAWAARDPVKLQRQRLKQIMTEEEVRDIEKQVSGQVESSLAKAKADPMPGAGVLYEGVLA
jgi:pyruvate dehydrogenase E1 component alpha subunit